MDTIRILRILEYIGPRDAVEEQVRNSIHGERKGTRSLLSNGYCTIRATTLGSFPEILELPERLLPTWDDLEMSVRSKVLMKKHYPDMTPAQVVEEWNTKNALHPHITARVRAEIQELVGNF